MCSLVTRIKSCVPSLILESGALARKNKYVNLTVELQRSFALFALHRVPSNNCLYPIEHIGIGPDLALFWKR